MSDYVLSRMAEEALSAIVDYYIEAAGPRVARDVVDRFERAFQLLAENPRIGHARPPATTGSQRLWLVYRYQVLYEPEAEPIVIVDIRHGSMSVT